MRAFCSQHGLRVAVSEKDIRDFNRRWPASEIRGLKGVTFLFENNGDLVDAYFENGNSDRWDGPALAALGEDAQRYGKKRCAAKKKAGLSGIGSFTRVRPSGKRGMTLHKDGSVTYWSVYEQVWSRDDAGAIPDREYAAMSNSDRDKVIRHGKLHGGLSGCSCSGRSRRRR